MASRIEDYGIVANGRTVALISKQGSVDWMCVPNFDSDACFSGLLGYDEHGRWVIRPTVAIKATRQEYERDSMILVTELTTQGGKARIVDFMPITEGVTSLVRIVEGIEGDVPLEVLLTPRFHYGFDRPRVLIEGGTVTMTAGSDSMILRGGSFERTPQGLSASVTVRAGESVKFEFSWFPSHLKAPAPIDVGFVRAPGRLQLLGRLGQTLPLPGQVPRRGAAFADDAQGAHLRAHRGDRRRSHRGAARGARRRAQLGLPPAGCATRRSRCTR